MTTFEAYKTYLALKLHFTTDGYDIRKTKGHVKASTATLDKNMKLQYELQRLKRKYSQRDFVNYLVANFISGDKYGGIYNTSAESVFLDWQARQDALTYKYKQDLERLSTLSETFEGLLPCKHSHPTLLKQYLGGHIMLETMVILDRLYSFSEHLDDDLFGDPIWGSVSKLMHKYSLFIKAGTAEDTTFRDITEKVFTNV